MRNFLLVALLWLATANAFGQGVALRSANNLSDLADAKAATTNLGLAVIHVTGDTVAAMTNAANSAKFLGQVLVSDGGQPTLVWSTISNGAPMIVPNRLQMGDDIHMRFDTNYHADQRVYSHFMGNPAYTNASPAGGNSTNWLFALAGDVIVNHCPYGPGSGTWWAKVDINGVISKVFGLYIGISATNAWEGFSPGFANITPDTGEDLLITSPVGVNNLYQSPAGAIQAINEYVFATQFGQRSVGFPYYVAGVTRPNVSSNQWMFYLKEDTGKIYATNNATTLFLTQLICGTNNQGNQVNNSYGIEQNLIAGGTIFDTTVKGAVIFDVMFNGSYFGRLAAYCPPGSGPVLAHGNAWPFVIGQYNAANMAADSSSLTFTEQLQVDNNGNLIVTNGSVVIGGSGSLSVPKTITAAGTTGAQTINKMSGSVNFAAAAQSITVTDSLVTTSSVIVATVAKDDTTAKSCIAVPGPGSFVLKLNAAATAETRVSFLITN